MIYADMVVNFQNCKASWDATQHEGLSDDRLAMKTIQTALFW
jgi:hypothetical protein